MERAILRTLNELDRKVDAMWTRHEAWEKAHPGEDRPRICETVGLIGRCTDTSVWLAERLGGVVHGYRHKDNPDAELGASEGGHDFVIVDDHWLVDWWAKDTYQERDLYDLTDEKDLKEVLRLYGDPGEWTPMDADEFAKYKSYIRTL